MVDTQCSNGCANFKSTLVFHHVTNDCFCFVFFFQTKRNKNVEVLHKHGFQLPNKSFSRSEATVGNAFVTHSVNADCLPKGRVNRCNAM